VSFWQYIRSHKIDGFLFVTYCGLSDYVIFERCGTGSAKIAMENGVQVGLLSKLRYNGVQSGTEQVNGGPEKDSYLTKDNGVQVRTAD
jgi:hypothetical protein